MELVCGFMAGIGQTIISHPLDTVKVFLQVQRKESYTLFTLYRGIKYPLLTNGIISSFAFQSYEACKKEDQKYGYITGGIVSGIITALLSYPFDYFKTRDQLCLSNKRFPKLGFVTTTMREIPACTFYYPVYDALKRLDIPTPISGGIAGVTCWLSCYPIDVVNTHVMTGKRIRDVLKELKWNDYYRGLFPTLIRAMPVNAIGYIFYESTKTLLQ